MILRRCPLHRLAPLAILALLAAPMPRAEAGLIFSNADPITDGGATPAGTGYLANLTISTTTTIGDIAVRTNTGAASNLKFVIFEFTSTGAPGTLLYESGPKGFSADAGSAFSYKMSDDFSFTLLAGHRYEIGALSDVASSSALDSTPDSQNGISSNDLASLASGYNGTPVDNDRVLADAQIELFSPSVVPEPSSLALCGIAGVAGLAYRKARRELGRS